jgi:DNA-binding FadR family transcriptional regulator
MERPAVTGVFAPVTSPSTFEATVARLGRAIRLGVLEPGARLPPERELAEQLSISRSTLRQALRTLTESGHLTAQRGRSGGTFVAADPPMSAGGREGELHRWRDLLDRRTAIELGAAQLAAERAEEGHLDPLAEHTATMRASFDDWRTFRRADVLFHICIAEATGTAWLIEAMTEVHGEFSELLDLVPHPISALEHSTDQHEQLVRAFAKGDGDAVLRLMRDHVRGSEALFEGLHPWRGAS